MQLYINELALPFSHIGQYGPELRPLEKANFRLRLVLASRFISKRHINKVMFVNIFYKIENSTRGPFNYTIYALY